MLLTGNLSPQQFAINLLVLLVGMAVHEFSHCYVGYLMGDPTPKQLGRLTLNPFVHINWMGWLMFAVLGFGVLGSAPIDSQRMRNPRWGGLAAVAAGPFSNLLLAVIFALLLRIVSSPVEAMLLMGTPEHAANARQYAILFLVSSILLNLLLFFFNLVPLFPLDGWRMTHSLLPPTLAPVWQYYQQVTFYLFIGLLLLSFVGLPVYNELVVQPTFTVFFQLLSPR